MISYIFLQWAFGRGKCWAGGFRILLWSYCIDLCGVALLCEYSASAASVFSSAFRYLGWAGNWQILSVYLSFYPPFSLPLNLLSHIIHHFGRRNLFSIAPDNTCRNCLTVHSKKHQYYLSYSVQRKNECANSCTRLSPKDISPEFSQGGWLVGGIFNNRLLFSIVFLIVF